MSASTGIRCATTTLDSAKASQYSSDARRAHDEGAILRETIIAPGANLEVTGLVTRELRTASAAERGYRDGPAYDWVLGGTEEHPLLIRVLDPPPKFSWRKHLLGF